MATIGHLAVGLAVARWRDGQRAVPLAAAMLGWSLLALAPDLDLVGFALGVRYAAPFGHRGASHSLAAALLVGAIAALLRRPRGATFLLVAGVVASHGVLDLLTDGGLGVALLWPLAERRLFAPLRPLPVAPIGAGLFSARGLSGMAREAIYFAPLLLYAGWPRRRRP